MRTMAATTCTRSCGRPCPRRRAARRRRDRRLCARPGVRAAPASRLGVRGRVERGSAVAGKRRPRAPLSCGRRLVRTARLAPSGVAQCERARTRATRRVRAYRRTRSAEVAYRSVTMLRARACRVGYAPRLHEPAGEWRTAAACAGARARLRPARAARRRNSGPAHRAVAATTWGGASVAIPGVILYFTYWSARRVRVPALFMTAIPNIFSRSRPPPRLGFPISRFLHSGADKRPFAVPSRRHPAPRLAARAVAPPRAKTLP